MMNIKMRPVMRRANILIVIIFNTSVQTCGVPGLPINAFNPHWGHRLPWRDYVRSSIADG